MSVKSNRIEVKPDESMQADELNKWMTKEGLSEKELAAIFGVTQNAVMFWRTGQRPVSVTNTRLIKLFKKYPTLIREF